MSISYPMHIKCREGEYTRQSLGRKTQKKVISNIIIRNKKQAGYNAKIQYLTV